MLRFGPLPNSPRHCNYFSWYIGLWFRGDCHGLSKNFEEQKKGQSATVTITLLLAFVVEGLLFLATFSESQEGGLCAIHGHENSSRYHFFSCRSRKKGPCARQCHENASSRHLCVPRGNIAHCRWNCPAQAALVSPCGHRTRVVVIIEALITLVNAQFERFVAGSAPQDAIVKSSLKPEVRRDVTMKAGCNSRFTDTCSSMQPCVAHRSTACWFTHVSKQKHQKISPTSSSPTVNTSLIN